MKVIKKRREGQKEGLIKESALVVVKKEQKGSSKREGRVLFLGAAPSHVAPEGLSRRCLT